MAKKFVDGEWVLEFEAPVGSRMMKGYWCATAIGGGLWYCYSSKKFVDFMQETPKGSSTHSEPIRSVKAFKRFLRKHPELKGQEVTLVSRWIGHNVVARWVEKSHTISLKKKG